MASGGLPNSYFTDEKCMEAPICLIENMANGKLVVNPEAINILSGIHQPVVVVSIVGMYRTGKSYLMNKLAGVKKGFNLGSTVHNETKGIWMWCVPHPTKKDHILVLLDTEGLGDVEKGDSKNDTWLFSLALLLSSALVYNSRGTIDQDALDKLKFVGEISNLIKVKAGRKKQEEEDEFSTHFPIFVWVVRDFLLELTIDGRQITADEYMENALRLRKAEQKKTFLVRDQEIDKIRELLWLYFRKRKCFTFDLPTFDRRLLRKLEQVSDNELCPEFVAQTKEFCEYVFRNAKVKRLDVTVPVTGQCFGELAKIYTDAICSSKIVCIEDAVISLSNTENQRAVREAIQHYQNKMKLSTETNFEFFNVSRQYEDEARMLFMEKSFRDENQKFLKEFLKNLHNAKNECWARNEKESQEVCEAIIKKYSANFEKNLMEGEYLKPGGHGMYIENLLAIEIFYNKESGKGVKAEQVLKEYIKSKKPIELKIIQVDNALSQREREMAEGKMRIMEKELIAQKHQEESATLHQNIKELKEKMSKERKMMDEKLAEVLKQKKRAEDVLREYMKSKEDIATIIIQQDNTLSQREMKEKDKLKIFHKLLDSLNMKYSSDSKLTLRHTLEIGEEILSDIHPQTIQDIPWHFLRKLMALNRAALNTHYEKDTQIINYNESNFMFDFMIEEESSPSESIHPLDVLCVLLHCSDNFLQQEIATKMAMCQFAVPLLLPADDGSRCTFMLWAMRDIVKKWRPQSLTDSKGFSEENVVNIPMPIFSFIRLGNTKLSKSKILNQVLNPAQQQHNVFIHDDMEGGNIERKISDGLVEMSWYFPCGKSDVFPEPITVTNLRGDLETNWEQFTFLTRVSSAVFIFIESISEIQFRLLSSCSNPGTQFYLIVTPEKGKKISTETSKHINNLMTILKMNATNIILKTSTASDAALVKKIQHSIENVIKNCQRKKQNLCDAKTEIQGLHISVDENSVECQKAKLHASKITSVIKDVEDYKKETLKLQGDLWKELSKVEKELCRMAKQGAKNAEEYQSELIQKRNSLHNEQYRHYVPTGIMYFTEAITDLSKAEKHYFLKWMKFEMDSVARNNISLLQSKYKETCKSKSATSELKQLDQKISDSSLGIEHFVRELGQFYEAEFSTVGNIPSYKSTKQFSKLPGIAADFLLDGFPLEVIDGDASNIPLQWITDVLTELDNKTGGHRKMRVITVLGVQSTGKSTLLNTMFGPQFPVASGRCTRGAFMTLLKVKENFQEDLGCHFILVIDTEGLKAPELASLKDSYEHDNELATLVVGLSDITIINMAMENTTEMKDILQIVVHAFLRMKEIGKKPNCQFVHQNVSDVSAHEKNMRDRKKFLEQLDEMTRVAANMEKKRGITCFRDVMDYDPEKHNWYIPGLWQGVPPMASVNFGYSENVYELKKYLLGFLKSQNSDRTKCKITDFIQWVESLWRAVKHEKFIFSFRNSLVAEAYTKLSMQYSLWEWDFTKNVHSWMTTKETHIRNQSAGSLNAEVHRQFISELQSLLLEEEDALLKLLEKYFENRSENVHLIERYKEDFFMSVRFLKKELERNALSKLHEAFSIQKGKLKILDIQKTCQKRIEEEITNHLLKSCRERNCELVDIDAKREFEEMWKKTLSDIQIEELTRRNIGQMILQQLKNEMCVKGGEINESLSSVMSLDNYEINPFVIDKSHIDKSYFSRSRNAFYTSQAHLDKIEDLTTTLIAMCETYIKEKVDNKGDYDDNYFQELLHMINDKLKDKTSTKLNFSLKFERDIKLFIFGKASRVFQDIHDRFIQENGPKMCLEKLKPQYLATFQSIFHEKTSVREEPKKLCELTLKPALTDSGASRQGNH